MDDPLNEYWTLENVEPTVTWRHLLSNNVFVHYFYDNWQNMIKTMLNIQRSRKLFFLEGATPTIGEIKGGSSRHGRGRGCKSKFFPSMAPSVAKVEGDFHF